MTVNLWNRLQKIHICSTLSDFRAIRKKPRLMQAHWFSSANNSAILHKGHPLFRAVHGRGYALAGKEINLYLNITTLYGQQKFMYGNKVHSAEHRIVNISQPWLRPIVRGKMKAPVEFGTKFDLSLDSEGYGRIEKYCLKQSK